MRRSRWGVLAVAASAATMAAATAVVAPVPAGAVSPPAVRMARLAPGAIPRGARSLGPVSASTSVAIDVVLAPADPAAVTTFLDGLYDPSSPRYHRWLARGQFVRRFGPAGTTVAAAERWLRDAGASGVLRRGFAVEGRVPAGALDAAFGISLQRVVTAGGTTGLWAQGAPLVPPGLAGTRIAGILGLDTLSRLHDQLQGSVATAADPHAARPAAQPHGDGLTPCAAATTASDGEFWTLDALGATYGVGQLLSAGENGSGQTVAAYELSPHSSSDVSTYLSCFGLSNPVSAELVDGGGTVDADGTDEADVDLEQAATQAPDASLVSYEGPNTAQGSFDVWNQIVTDDTAQVVTSSWGECEPDAVSDGTLSADDPLFAQAAGQGQTVLVASGDSGSEDCFRSDGTGTEEVDYPGSNPDVTTVGGTQRYSDGSEVTWNYCQADESENCADEWGGQAAGGGGQSREEARPGFEPSLLTWPQAQTCGTRCRETPDIAANAGSGMVAYYGGSWGPVGGTSLAAPFVAGIVADRNVACSTTTGEWAPALYGLGQLGAYGTALKDITQGNNDMLGTNAGQYRAGTGYDAASGLGSPEAAGLACPQVRSVSPAVLLPGLNVTIGGLGLEHATFRFGGTTAHVVSSSATQAVVTVPSGSGSTTVSASSVDGTGVDTAPFTFGQPGSSHGYWLVGADGGIFTFGSAHFYGSTGAKHLNRPVVGITPTSDRRGYWLVASDGGIFSFGDTTFYGSIPGLGILPYGSTLPGPKLAAPIVGMVPSADGKGYFLVGADGGVFSFGDAKFEGSCPGLAHGCDGPAVAVVPDATGHGYWLVTSVGSVYTFGDAPYDGAPVSPGSPATAAVRTPDGGGYWILLANGTVDGFGDAYKFGSLPAGITNVFNPATAIVAASDDSGYWIVTADGRVTTLGVSPDDGQMYPRQLNAPIIAAAGW